MSGSPAARDGAGMVDLAAQARKALSERHPFDADDSSAAAPLRDASLPAILAAVLSRAADGRRKHKKSHHAGGDHQPHPGPGRPPKPPTVWEQNEEYFRPVTVSDVEVLIPRPPFVPARPLDPCLCIPFLGSSVAPKEESLVNDATFEAGSISDSVRVVPEAAEKARVVKEEQQKDKDMAMPDSAVNSMQEEMQEEEEDKEDALALNWLLGSKQRCVLTSERPNKKRKLLGGDAGLERLLRLPHQQEDGDGASTSLACDVCCMGEYNAKSNGVIVCNSCKVSVHRKCYGVHGASEGLWVCSWCKHLEGVGELSKDGEGPSSRPCVLCPKGGGALKHVGGAESSGGDAMKFVHLFCSLWAPEVYVKDTEAMEPVLNIGGVLEMRRRLVCNLCKVKHGVCVRCSHGTCRTSFHPVCAREARHQMEIWGKSGCENVELRAFCSKHSTLQDKGVSQSAENFARVVDVTSSTARPLSTCLPTNILLKLRLTRSNKDKNMKQDETTCSISDNMVKSEATSEQQVIHLGSRTSGEAQRNKDKDMDWDIGGGNSLSTSCNLIQVLKKLIDRGKFNVGDVAAKMGISCNSLEALLLDDMATVSPELKQKIIKWIEDSVHLPVSKLHSNLRGGSTLSSGCLESGADGPTAASVTRQRVPDCVQETEFNIPDSCLEPSLAQRRTKGSIRILKEDKSFCSSGQTFPQNDDGNLVHVNGEAREVDTMGDSSHNHDHDHDHCNRGPSEMNSEGTSSFQDASPSTDLLHKGTPSKQDNDVPVADHQHQPLGERVAVLDSGVNDVYNTTQDALNKGGSVHPDYDISMVDSLAPYLKDGESCGSSYVHPFIKKKLIQVQKHMLSEQGSREAKCHGYSEKGEFSVDLATPACTSSHQQALHSMDVGSTRVDANVDQFANARDAGILELSPEDEIEGELLYLQNRLLDKAVAIKRSCEELICRVVRSLPQELDAFKRQRWDLVLVSQFLRELREAKKRGRKERRHREAQAVLAAAAAAAASSSRTSSVRKDTTDEAISAHQESPLKVSTASGRAALYSPLLPRAKETLSRSAVVKLPPDKLVGTFQIPDFSKESALSCDICRRGETVLNRIFVCSSCKVAVHLDCYRKFKDPVGSWKCELCEEMSLQSVSPRNQTADNRETSSFVAQCGLCGGTNGAFRKSTDGQWVHAFCTEWLLESTFKRGQHNLVEGMEAISREKDLLPCSICRRKFGVCLKCSYGHCQIAFHPSCARSTGLYMNVKGIGGRLQHKAYCAKHSLEQREADIKQHGAEELKSMKQIRVELEKLRLLCERIIKREKLKRELVLCSHEIHASSRDCVAFSALVRSSFFPPGGSSESATTSIDDKSYSGIQRSDDVTVDSAVCSNRTVRLPLRMDIDRRTDDSSNSQLSFKRKLDDRTTFSGKQLPRSASVAFRSSADGGEKRSKARKHTETFQKELVMTSVQASIQNKRLPKGFVYVPVGCLSEEKPATGDSESRETREPGG